MIQASKNAASYQYDNSKYIIIDSNVRREADTGRLVSQDSNKR